MSKKISVGVIGAGSMGQHHVRVYSELKCVDKVYLYDTDTERAQKIADFHSATAVTDHRELVGKCDAVSIAVPTDLHTEVGAYFLSHKIPCLIEKPLALSGVDCQRLVETAEVNNTPLLVAHVERFNPAFIELKRIIDQGVKVYSIEAQRLSYASSRSKNTDVIFDLMIHDIDIAMNLLGTEIKTIHAQNISSPDPWGHIVALMKDENDVLINLTASRVTQNKVRTLSLVTNVGWFQLDFLNQELSLYHGGKTKKISDIKDSIYKLDLTVEKVFVRNQEPLSSELKHFLDCVIEGKHPIISGRCGSRVVSVAERIRDSIATTTEHSTELKLAAS